MHVSPRPSIRSGTGPPSQILHASARRHHFSGVGALSVKTFRHGQAHYRVGRGCYTMGENSYLVLNHGQPYTLDIDAPQPVDSFCIFFAPDLMADAQRNLALTTIRLLDEPAPASLARINFFERIYPSDTFLAQLNSFRKALPAHHFEPGWLDAQWHALANGLLATHRRECRRVEALPALRATTRDELYRRLHRARDYACSRFDQPLTLNELAGVACLSPNHFLRAFKQAFHETPHQFLTRVRLDAACSKLRRGRETVTEICLAVGFESPGSFSSLFRRRFGVSPSQLQKGDFREAPAASTR